MTTKIHYARVDEFWTKEQKYAYLENAKVISMSDWHSVSETAKKLRRGPGRCS